MSLDSNSKANQWALEFRAELPLSRATCYTRVLCDEGPCKGRGTSTGPPLTSWLRNLAHETERNGGSGSRGHAVLRSWTPRIGRAWTMQTCADGLFGRDGTAIAWGWDHHSISLLQAGLGRTRQVCSPTNATLVIATRTLNIVLLKICSNGSPSGR